MSTRDQDERIELLQGTLDLLILRTLQLGPLHGHAIAKAIEFRSDDVLQVEQGSLYPALHRLERRKLVSSSWQTTENGRNAKLYTITAAGKTRLAEALRHWKSVAKGVKLVVRFQRV